MGEFIKLIEEIKEGEKEKFVLIVGRFEPMIKKYIRYLYKDEREDVRSELILALWESVINITYTKNDGQVINYLSNAIKNKYYELYRASKKRHDNEISNQEEKIFLDIRGNGNFYNDVITQEDINSFIKSNTALKRKIYSAMMIGLFSDVEISNLYGVSRQYVNRLRRNIRNLILSNNN